MIKKTFCKVIATLCLVSLSLTVSAEQIAWYVAFSGESDDPINNIYALSVETGSVLGEVLVGSKLHLKELRNMTIGPDGNLYVSNAQRKRSRIIKFGPINSDGLTRDYLSEVVTITTSGLLHPYQPVFSPEGNLYISNQDTNIVLRVFGPNSAQLWAAMPNSPFLLANYPHGEFSPGTFVPAFTASAEAPSFTPVPPEQGGLTTSGETHAASVRGLTFAPNHQLFVSDEGNNRVVVYDSETGQLLHVISDAVLLLKPVQIFYNSGDGLIYIACSQSERILRYNPTTQVLSTFIHDSRLSQVSGIAFGEDGNFYAGDRLARVINRYDSQGNFVDIFAGPFTDSPEGILAVYSNYPG